VKIIGIPTNCALARARAHTHTHTHTQVLEALDAVLKWAQERAAAEGENVLHVVNRERERNTHAHTHTHTHTHKHTHTQVGQTQLLIVPGYKFALCDFLFTNTHQPR
jgi:S-adenosylmethionine:tRNA-ribosyltransferase-isomerase (queuine synthetase)